MRVLVTRPENAGRRTAAALRALGHEPVLLPLMAAEHHIEAAREALDSPHAALAVTSAEALRVLGASDDQMSISLDTPLFAVGEATARAARELGFRSVETADGTGTGMATIFGDRLAQMTRDLPLLYLAGTPRSPAFEAGLAARDIPVVVAESYSMHPLPVDGEKLGAALLDPPVDAVLLYSRETAKRFFDLPCPEEASVALRKAAILCLSPNVAEAVPAPLKPNVRSAPRPDEESLLALL